MNGQPDRAIEDLNKAISLDPTFSKAYLGRGMVYAGMCLFELAIEEYSKAISLAPNDAWSYYYRGIAYRRGGELGKAQFDLQKSCDLGNELACKDLRAR